MTELRPDVVTPAGSDWATVSDVLAEAFVDDPVFSWMIRNSGRRPAALRRYFAIEARDIALAHGVSVAAVEGERTLGAALVFPPERWRMPLRVLARRAPAYLRIFAQRTPHALGVLAAVERRHLSRPHYYFGYIGVSPAAQGRGVGTTMLAPALDRCDAEAMPAYLEASSPGSAALYARLGFETVEDIRPLGAPPIRLMTREPR